MTETQKHDIIPVCTPILSADQQPKEDIMLDQQKITIIYCRLSVEDIKEDARGGKADESNSIQNQKEYLTRYAKDHGYTNLKILVDDGYTGTNFNRPGVQEGFELVKQGLVGCWLVKDLSRFGRDYLTVGQYTDIIFPSYDVRFIAVNDGVDSERGDSEGMAAIRNLFNEWYPRDTSKKVRVSLHQRGTSGKHMGKPPYGYRCDPEDKEHWILDEEAAPVVKMIFDMSIDGKGPEQIARILEEKQILTAKALYAKRKKKPMPERPYHWIGQSVVGILERQEYTGCTVNFKTYSKYYKLKKRIPNDPENMFYLPDTQEAIVSQAQFDRVQELRKNKRRPAKAERQGFFSGLLFCADCGGKLHFATSKSFEGKQDHYVCNHYKSNRGTCTAHYIREDVLVKSFWNASGQSTSISVTTWTAFRRNICNAEKPTMSKVSVMTKRKWNRQKSVLLRWMSLSHGCMRTSHSVRSARTDTRRCPLTMRKNKNVYGLKLAVSRNGWNNGKKWMMA